MSKEMHLFFDGFDAIHDRRHQYNVEWAFKDVQEKLADFHKRVIEGDMQTQCMNCLNSKKLLKSFDIFNTSSLKALKKQRLMTSVFSNMYIGLTVLEFIASVLLVLVVSNLSHSGEALFESSSLGIMVVLTFAVLKVVLERQVLKPMIENLGWSLYKNSVLALRDMSMSMSNQIESSSNALDFEAFAAELA